MKTVLNYKLHIIDEVSELKKICQDIANIIELSNIKEIRNDINTYKPDIIILEYSHAMSNNGYYMRLIKEINPNIYIMVDIPEFIGEKNLQDLYSSGRVCSFINPSSSITEVKAMINFIIKYMGSMNTVKDTEKKYEEIENDYKNYKDVLTSKDEEIGRLKKYIDEISIEDELTKLANEKYFITSAKTMLEEAKRYRDNACVSMLEIDNIAQIEEVYGKECVEKVFAETAQLIKKHIRKNDIAAITNDHKHFLLIYKKIDFYSVRNVSNRMRNTLAEHVFLYNNKQLRITVSVGLASCINYLRNSYEYEDLIAQVRIALDNAIKKGRNQVVAYS
ncbi:GGDEF domain-containing protein [Spirochaetota bacterium]